MTRHSDSRQRVLIVDDQPANIRVMAEILQGDYELFFATSGAKALEVVAANDIELVLLDVVMPDMDGFEVCSRLKSDPRTSRIPVIFVTAREETHDETRGFEAGAVDYIIKPIVPPIVRARVRTHLELERARDLLERMASIDGLTGIANRRQLDTFLAHEWKRAAGSGSPISIAILDVDHFKVFNDTHGHAKGDECLRAIAQALLSVARRGSDLAARYGGEEFAIVLPDTPGEAMASLLGLLLETVRGLCLATVSVGAVTLIPAPGADPSSALEAADRLLYEVKRGGRNHALHADAMRGSRQRIDSAQTVAGELV
jgi:diguanylate cyclase (GGDEF)-like protein